MDFFNKIGEKISSGATAVSNSTKRMAEIAKLNSKIGRAENDITQKYTEIGRIVKLELMENIYNDDVKRLAAEIDDLNAEISEAKESICALKGLKYCANCGAQVGGKDVFCANCGTKQPEQEPEAQPCAAPLSEPTVEVQTEETPAEKADVLNEDAAVKQVTKETSEEDIPVVEAETVIEQATADEIGETMVDVDESAVETIETDSARTSEIAQTTVESKYIFCTKCGNKEESGSKFCSECGTKLDY